MIKLTPFTKLTSAQSFSNRTVSAFWYGVLVVAIAGRAQAGTDTWVGSTSAGWATAANWSGNAVPSNGDTLSFGSPGSFGTSLTDNISSLTLGGSNTDGIDFSYGGNASTSYSITPSSATLTLASSGTGVGINDTGINATIISVPLVLNSTQTINVGSSVGDSGSASLALSGAISGGAGIGFTKTGGGILSLSSSNTFGTAASPGAVKVTGGVLSVTNDNQLGTDPGAATAGNIVLDGGALRTTATLNSNRGVALGDSGANSGGTIDTANSSVTIGGIIANNGGTNSLTKTGAGTLSLTGANTYTGQTIINQGLLVVDANLSSTAAINSSSTLILGGTPTVVGPVADASNASFELQGNSGSTSVTQTFSGLVVNAGPAQIQSRNISNAASTTIALGAITQNAGGVLLLSLTSAGNTQTGSITTSTSNDATGILGGWAVINNTNPNSTSFQLPTDYAANNGSGKLVAYTGYTAQSAGAVTSGASNNLRVSASGGVALSVASGTTYLNTLSNAGTATGTTSVTIATGGTLNFGPAGGLLNASGAGSVNLSGGSVTAGGSTANTPGTITIIDGSGGDTISSNIVDNGAGAVSLVLEQMNGNNLTLSGANTYSGNTYVNEGRILLNSTTGFGTGTVTVAPTAQVWLGFSGTLANNFVLSGASNGHNDTPSAIRMAGSQTLSGTITLASDATIGYRNTSGNVISGQITGNYNLTLGEGAASGGNLTLTNTANNWGGNLYINDNTVTLGASNVLPSGSATGIVSLNSNSVLNLANFNATINALSSTATNSSVTLGTGTLTLGGNNVSSTFAGKITGTGNVVTSGSVNQTFISNSNTFSTFVQNSTGTTSLLNSGGTGNLTVKSVAIQKGTLLLTDGYSLTNNGTALTTSISSGATLLINILGSNSNNKLWSDTYTGAGTIQIIGTTSNVVFGDNGGNGYLQLSQGGLIDVEQGTLNSNKQYLNSGTYYVQTFWTGNQSSLKIASGATFAVNDTNPVYVDAITGGGTITGGSTGVTTAAPSLYLGVANGTGTFTGTINDSASTPLSLIKQGTGTETLTGSNSYIGGTTISAGTLKLGSATALGASNGNLAANATLDLNGNSATVGSLSGSTSGVITSSAVGNLALTTGGSASTSYLGVIQNGSATSLTLNVNGTGTLVLGHDTGTGITTNNYSGGTNISGGALVVGDGAGNAGAPAFTSLALGSGAVNVTNGTLAFNTQNGGSSTVATTANSITLNSSQLLSIDGYNTLTGGLAINGTGNLLSTEYGGKNLYESGALTGAGSATIQYTNPGAYQATGQVEFAGNGTGFTGTITLNNSTDINAGTTIYGEQIVIGNSNALANAHLVFTGASKGNTALLFDTSPVITAATIGSIASTNSGDGSFALQNYSGTAVALTVGGNNATTTYSGVISSGGSIIKTGTGTLTLAGANTYTGGTTLNAGALQVNGTETPGTSGPLGKSGNINFTGGTLQLTSTDHADYSSRIASGTSSSAVAIDINGQSLSFATGLTSGQSGGLTLTSTAGGGVLTLNTGNSYTGTTTVTSGTLAIGSAGSVSSSSTISIGASGIFQYAVTGSPTFSNTISGSGLAQIYAAGTGSSTTNLSGDLTGFTGILDINPNSGGGGKVLLSGATPSSSATIKVENGGTLWLGPSNYANSIQLYGGTTGEAIGQLRIEGTTVSGGVTLNANSSIGGNGTGSTISGIISDGGSGYGFTKLGGNTLTLSGANTYSGATTLGGGVLQVNGTENPGTSGPLGKSGNINFTGGTLQLTSADHADYSSRIATGTSTSAVAIDINGQSLSFATGLTSGQSGGLTLTSSAVGGVLTLNTANSYSGTTTITTGTLAVGGSAGSVGSGTINIGGSGTLKYAVTGNPTLANSFTGSGLAQIYAGGTASNTTILSGSLSGFTGTLDINPNAASGGKVELTSSSTTPPSSATIKVENGGTLWLSQGVTYANSFQLYGGTTGEALGQLRIENSTISGGITLKANTTIGDYTGNNGTISGIISSGVSQFGFEKVGSGTLTLSGQNTYTGGTTISGGTLAAGVNNAIAPSSAVTVAGGTWAVGSFNDTVNDVTLKSGSITGTTGVITSTTGYDLFNGTVSAVLADANSSNYLTKDLGGVGANTVTLSGVNTYADTVVVADGTLAFTNGNTSSTGNQALGTNSTLYLGFLGVYATPVTLQYTGSGAATLAKDISAQSTTTNTIQNSGTGQLTLSGNVDKSDTNLILSGGSNGILVTGNITSANAQNSFDSDIYITSGTTTLDNSNNTYDGATHIYGNGVLVNGLSNALPSATVVELGNSDSTASEAGASFTNVYNLNGYNQTVAGLTSTNPANFTDNNSVVGGTGNGANSLSTLTVTPSGTDTYSGLIGGSGSNQNNVALVMSGTGTLALTGNNTYTGGTTVSSGFLNVTGSIANSAVSIASGATLSGTGTTGAVTNNAGGKIGLQDGSIGTLTVGGLTTGALNGTTTSAFTFDIGSTLGSNDKINDSGTLTLLGIGGTNGTTITIGNATGTTSLASGLYNLISYTGTYTGSLSNLNLLTTTLDGAYLSLVQGSGVIQLQVSSTAPSAGPAFFNGTTSDLNTASNYDTSVSSGTSISSAPGSSTNVSFSANRNSNTTGNVSAPLTVNSLAFGVGSGTNQETITSSGSGSITIQASAANGNTSGNGITVNSGTDSISAPVVLGASQSWTTSATSSLTVSGQVSGTGFALTKAGTGSLILSNPTGNTYTGGTTVSGGKLYVNNTSNSGTGSGAVTVNGGTLAGKGIIATSAGVVINGGGSLASGLAQSTTSKAVDGTHLAFNNTPVTVGSSTGTANLTFALGSGTSGIKGGTASGQYDFSNPNNNTTYLSLIGSSSINFAGTTSISLVDLTNTTGSNGSLSLRLSSPYLLITAGSNADYLNLVINSGTTANPIYSLSQSDANVNGWVVGVYTGGAVNGTDVSAINISQFGADGVTPLTPGANGTYPAPVLYLDAGNLEVVPEPGTWALMLGGLALLVVIQRRRNKIS